MINDLMQFTLFVLILIALVVPMGMWLARTFSSPSHARLERLTYKILGIDPEERMSWKRYGMALLLSDAAMMGLGYLFLRIQNLLPFDPLGRSAQTPDLAFNTAASFVTNTNWQSYSGETSLSNFSQMAAITFLMMMSAATGLAAVGGFIRGLSRKNASDIGNFWVDFTRCTYRVLVPLSFLVALIYVWQGIPQTLDSAATDPTTQRIPLGAILGRRAKSWSMPSPAVLRLIGRRTASGRPIPSPWTL
jgi:potassium-transporting ATPase potassium-binding subunit